MILKSNINGSEWPSSKSLQTINADEDVEKKEHFYTVGTTTTENSMEVTQEVKNRTAI